MNFSFELTVSLINQASILACYFPCFTDIITDWNVAEEFHRFTNSLGIIDYMFSFCYEAKNTHVIHYLKTV